MRPTASLCPAATDDDAILDDDATDGGVVASQPLTAFGERDRGAQPSAVI
jgi:hypothetical protein